MEIREDFKKLLPPLSSEEYLILEESLLCEGCREPLIVWNDILVDGHNRYEICSKHNIRYNIEEIHADNEDDIKIWIIDNQKGRRNLTDGWKFELAQVRKEILIRQGESKRNPGFLGNQYKSADLSTIDKTPHNTRNELAKELGWSTGKVAMADKVWKDATPEIKEATKSGEMSINEAYKEVRKEQNIKNRERVREKYETTKPPDVQKKYRIIYADPPWMYDKGKELSDKYGDVQKHYPPMEIDDICNLPITELCEKDCVLFLWATAPKLPEALRVIDAWGFQYKTNIVWDKVKHNFGFYFSVRHELLLIAGKGSSTPDTKELHDSVIEIERSNKHSEKPKYFRELIDKLYTNGNRIELFAREKIDNWDNWGNEL